MAPRNNLKLVSFDGGGLRGLSQLEIMRIITHQLNWKDEPNGPNEHRLPCDHFDLIGGSGTGGLIAILLAKLRMSVDEASDEFCKIIEKVYNPKNLSSSERTKALRRFMEDVMIRKELPVDLQLTKEQQGGCASFVVASPRTDPKGTLCLRTYPVRTEPSPTITVIDAVLAACATQPDFAPVSSGFSFSKREYIAAIGATNPVHDVITEAHLLFGPDAKVVSLLSIGAGHPGTVFFPSAGGEAASHRTMRDMMYDCEKRAQEIEQWIGHTGIYTRLSVEQGMQNDHLEQISDPGWVTTQTDGYLNHPETGKKLDLLVQNVNAQTGLINLDQLNQVGGSNSAGRIVASVEKSLEILISNQDDGIIAKLKPADLECDSPVSECLEGTRRDIVAAIHEWRTEAEAPNILWINAHPGVGKSAIATTLVEELRSSTRLGSSFFFQRERANVMTPHALWRRVAYDLARRSPIIRTQIVTVLTANDSLPTIPNLDTLFGKLIYEPLMASNDIPAEKSPIVVMDALDECGGLDGRFSDHREGLMRTLKRWSTLPSKFKLVVTSRRESDIEELFSTTPHRALEIFAGKKVNSMSSKDVRAFLKHGFRQIATQYRSLPPNWPGERTVGELTDRAAGLFIWVKTIMKLLARREPQRTLKEVLKGGISGMASLYTWILNASFPSPTNDEIQDFRSVLGAIIFTEIPLDVTSLKHLLSISGSALEYISKGLQSVLECGDTLRIHHRSFVDFLLNPKECPEPFLINRERENRSLTTVCLDMMKIYLRFNICSLESSYVRNHDVPDLDLRVKKHIPTYVSYSSRYWAIHLAETSAFDDDTLSALLNRLQYFIKFQFLFWLEVLSLLKCVGFASQMLRLLTEWMQKHNQDETMAREMHRFVAAFANVIAQSAPHIYISALPFSPRSSPLSEHYKRLYPRTLTIQSGGFSDWLPAQNVLFGHTSETRCVAFSPDGKRVISGSSDWTLRIWDPETGEAVGAPLKGHNDFVNSVAFSFDGKRIVSGSKDNTIRVWDAETGEMIGAPFEGHTLSVNSIAFSPDGSQIVSGSRDNTVRIWDSKTGHTVGEPFVGHTNWVNSVAFSSDGKRIISGSDDKMVCIWDAETGKLVGALLKGHTRPVSSVAFSPDGKRIITGSIDRTVRIWNATTGEVVGVPFEGHTLPVSSVAFSPDGKRVVSGSSDRTICIWDAETGKAVGVPLKGHISFVTSVTFSHDGKRIASGSGDRTVRIWDTDIGEVVEAPFEGHTRSIISVAFSPDGRRIASSSDDTTIRVWDTETGMAVGAPFEGHTKSIESIAFSPDGKRIVSGSLDRTACVWDAETGKVVGAHLKGHHSFITSVAFSPDGRRIVSGSGPGPGGRTLRIWDAETGGAVGPLFKDYKSFITSVAFSPDGGRIASGSVDRTVRIWDAETGEPVGAPLGFHARFVNSLAFSPDGKRVVSGSDDKTIRVWNVETGEAVGTPFKGHTLSVNSVAFSPDGKHIVSGSWDTTVRIWDAETGKPVGAPFTEHTDRVYSVAYSPDGKRIVSGSGDRTVRVWSGRTGSSTSPVSSLKLENGWMVNSNSELLFWVPPHLRAGIITGDVVLIIGRLLTTKLDLTSFVHGEAWTLCKS